MLPDKSNRVFHSSNGDISFGVQGTGQWVIFCHALATNKKIWDGQLDQLGRKFSILTYDLPGHGKSAPSADNDYSFDSLSDQLVALMDYLKIESAHLVGLSVGGEIAQVAASRYPNRIKGLVLVSTGCFTSPERKSVWDGRIMAVIEKGMQGIAKSTSERWFSQGFADVHPGALENCRNWISETDLSAFLGLVREIQRMDLRESNKAIQCPTLILCGVEDHNTGLPAAKLIASTILGSKLCEIPAAGHFPNIEMATQFNCELIEFIDS